MAKDKKTVVVYTDWIEKFEELTDEEAGRLIKHFFRYVNDQEPEAPDRTTKLMFIDIKNTLKSQKCVEKIINPMPILLIKPLSCLVHFVP